MAVTCHWPSIVPMPMGVGSCPLKKPLFRICSIIWPTIPKGLMISTCHEPISVWARFEAVGGGVGKKLGLAGSGGGFTVRRGSGAEGVKPPCCPVIPHNSRSIGSGSEPRKEKEPKLAGEGALV